MKPKKNITKMPKQIKKQIKFKKQKKQGRSSRILLKKDPLYATLQRTIDGEINLLRIAKKNPELYEKIKKNSFKRIKEKMALKRKQMRAHSSLDFN